MSSEFSWPIKEKLCVGAEATIYRINFLGEDAVLKMRGRKEYRALKIDEAIRRRRTQIEAALLNKVKTIGINAPYVFYTDLEKCLIVMEYIGGLLLKNSLRMGKVDWRWVARKMGEDLGKMHEVNIVHGDLTTSNVFYLNSTLIYFDFGLGSITREIEDKAVDLELLYRVMRATHHEISEEFMDIFLKSYGETNSAAAEIISRFKKIRFMGRYVAREKR